MSPASPTRISIALATFNGAAFLKEQLDSFAAQDRLPDELVVADDGSSDDTRGIVERFAAAAPFPVRLLDGPAAGAVTPNFERAIRGCAGDIILLSDQDDIWLAGKIAAVEHALAGAPQMLALHHDEWLFDSATGQRLALTFNQRARRTGGWEHQLYVGNCTALRRELLPIVLPIPPGWAFDDWLSLVPEMLGARLILEQPLQLWRRHGNNASQAAIAEPAPPGPLALARRFAGHDPRPGWAREAARLDAVRQRIDQCREAIDQALGAGRAARASADLAERIGAIERRAARLGRPRALRWPGIFGALVRGDYRRFAGWRSAAKDAIRKR